MRLKWKEESNRRRINKQILRKNLCWCNGIMMNGTVVNYNVFNDLRCYVFKFAVQTQTPKINRQLIFLDYFTNWWIKGIQCFFIEPSHKLKLVIDPNFWWQNAKISWYYAKRSTLCCICLQTTMKILHQFHLLSIL